MLFKNNKVRLWWHLNDGLSNFGDILNPYLVKKISGKEPVWTPIRRFDFRPVHVSIGSVMAIVNRHCVVWGSGIIKKTDNFGPAKFLAVRGPLTGKRLTELGYSDPQVYGDPALLLPLFYQPNPQKKYRLGVIPHHVDYELAKEIFKDQQVKVINLINDNVTEVIDEISSCECTISSSLHGLIVSHAYSIPSLWVKFSDKLYGDGVKFDDYFLSVGIEPYQAIDYMKDAPSTEALLEIIMSDKSRALIQTDFRVLTDRLMAVCPFKPGKGK